MWLPCVAQHARLHGPGAVDMRIAFTDEVLADPDSWRWLDRVLESVEDEWHL